MVFWFGRTVQFTRVNSRITWPMVLVRLRIKMATRTKVIGSTTKQTVLEFICTFQEPDMKVNGRKINSTDMELKNGPTGTNTQATMSTVRKKAKAN